MTESSSLAPIRDQYSEWIVHSPSNGGEAFSMENVFSTIYTFERARKATTELNSQSVRSIYAAISIYKSNIVLHNALVQEFYTILSNCIVFYSKTWDQKSSFGIFRRKLNML